MYFVFVPLLLNVAFYVFVLFRIEQRAKVKYITLFHTLQIWPFISVLSYFLGAKVELFHLCPKSALKRLILRFRYTLQFPLRFSRCKSNKIGNLHL